MTRESPRMAGYDRLLDKRYETRLAALRELVEDDPLDLPERLIGCLDDRAVRVRRYCMVVLRRLGERAVAALVERADAAGRGARCVVVLAATRPGRECLAAMPEQALGLLTGALALPDLTAPQQVCLVKALVIGPMPQMGDVVAPLLHSPYITVRLAAGRALTARWDARALDFVLAQRRWPFFSPPIVRWLGELGDSRALPLLRRLASWRALFSAPEIRPVAREAIGVLLAAEAHIPGNALSRVAPPAAGPGEAALSLWRSEDEEGEEA